MVKSALDDIGISGGDFHFQRLIIDGVNNGNVLAANNPEMANEEICLFHRITTGFGVKKGDAVALLLPNIIPCVAAYYAILQIGALAVMNNPLYSDPELEHQFNDSGSKVLITLDVLTPPNDRSASKDEDQSDCPYLHWGLPADGQTCAGKMAEKISLC